MAAIRPILSLSLLAMFIVSCNDDNSTPGTSDISGPITANDSWGGTVRLTGSADIAAGVDITVASGTLFEAAQGTVLQVHGSLSVNGTAGAPVSIHPSSGAARWVGIVVESGGAVTIHHATGSGVDTLLTCRSGALDCLIDTAVFDHLGHAVETSARVSITKSDFHYMNNGAVTVNAGGDLTITDSVIWGAQGGDLIILNGGKLALNYCDIGSSALDSNEHGNLFVNSSTGLTILYCNIISAPYGISVGGTNAAQVTFSNFMGNEVDILSLGNNVSGSLTSDYWDQGAPTNLGSEFYIGSPAPTPILGAGPRS